MITQIITKKPMTKSSNGFLIELEAAIAIRHAIIAGQIKMMINSIKHMKYAATARRTNAIKNLFTKLSNRYIKNRFLQNPI